MDSQLVGFILRVIARNVDRLAPRSHLQGLVLKLWMNARCAVFPEVSHFTVARDDDTKVHALQLRDERIVPAASSRITQLMVGEYPPL